MWARHASAPGNSQPTKKDEMMFDRMVSIHKLILTDSTPTAEQVLTRNRKLLTSSTLILPLRDQPAKNCVPLLIINKLVYDLSWNWNLMICVDILFPYTISILITFHQYLMTFHDTVVKIHPKKLTNVSQLLFQQATTFWPTRTI